MACIVLLAACSDSGTDSDPSAARVGRRCRRRWRRWIDDAADFRTDDLRPTIEGSVILGVAIS